MRNTLLTKPLIYSVKIYFAQYHTPLKNFMDNPLNHTNEEENTSQFLFCHNKGMNTIICVLHHFFPSFIIKKTTWVPMSSHSNALLTLTQSDVNFLNINVFWATIISKQDTETDSLISEDFALEVVF